jgi:hypothetical protein
MLNVFGSVLFLIAVRTAIEASLRERHGLENHA